MSSSWQDYSVYKWFRYPNVLITRSLSKKQVIQFTVSLWQGRLEWILFFLNWLEITFLEVSTVSPRVLSQKWFNLQSRQQLFFWNYCQNKEISGEHICLTIQRIKSLSGELCLSLAWVIAFYSYFLPHPQTMLLRFIEDSKLVWMWKNCSLSIPLCPAWWRVLWAHCFTPKVIWDRL